ncbi:hypothetical protein AURDEDRAFT_159339 [Auricularia subglabra TFB-10046 SS5]|nr:hypothetical protein AURDEDRAFT_159339 [Auricularia subglabra TFB-10046 SS5]
MQFAAVKATTMCSCGSHNEPLSILALPVSHCNFISQRGADGVVRWVKTRDCGQSNCTTSDNYLK